MVVPVLVDAEVVAVLCVDSIRPDNFTDGDQRLLETLAIHVGSELGRLRDEDKLRRSRDVINLYSRACWRDSLTAK